MKYLLSEEEFNALGPLTVVMELKQALALARTLIISDEKCFETHYCCDCPIGRIEDYKIMNNICHSNKHWPK